MADVHEGSEREASSVRAGQQTARIVLPGEDRGQKTVVPDLGKGQKPRVEGSKAGLVCHRRCRSPGPPPRPKKEE